MGDGLIQAMGEGCPSNPLLGNTQSEETKAQRGHSNSETQSKYPVQALQPLSLGTRDQWSWEADPWVWNQGFLLPKERRPHFWGRANGPILGD